MNRGLIVEVAAAVIYFSILFASMTALFGLFAGLVVWGWPDEDAWTASRAISAFTAMLLTILYFGEHEA